MAYNSFVLTKKKVLLNSLFYQLTLAVCVCVYILNWKSEQNVCLANVKISFVLMLCEFLNVNSVYIIGSIYCCVWYFPFANIVLTLNEHPVSYASVDLGTCSSYSHMFVFITKLKTTMIKKNCENFNLRGND